MPENRLIYLGIILIVASLSVWLGAELTRRIEWAVPYVGGAGIVLIAMGVTLEIWRSKRTPAAEE